MKRHVIALSAWVVVLSAAVVHAQDLTMLHYYQVQIDQKILECEQRAGLVHSREKNLKGYGQEACDQAAFFRNRKDRLAEEMVRRKVGTKAYQIDYFLIKAYTEAKKQADASEDEENLASIQR